MKRRRSVLPAGTKILRTRIPALAVDPVRLPAGTVICQGAIIGRAVPWKSPSLGRNGGIVMTKDYASYLKWKRSVATQARRLMVFHRRSLPYGGPVDFHAVFHLHPARSRPDRTNLLKSTEDAMQGVVYANDRQVAGGESRIVVDPLQEERVVFRVVAI